MKRVLRKIMIALAYLLVWQGLALMVGSPLKLPSPVETAGALLRIGSTAPFYQSIGLTLLRVLAGFAAGVAVGAALGAVTAAWPLADEFLAPLRTVIKATPVTSFIILVLLWLTSALTPVFIAFLMVTPIVWANVREGARAVDKGLLEMARVFRLSRGTVITKIYAPAVLPQFTAACTTGLGFAWKSGVAAEVIASTELSIGRSIMESKLYLEVPELFAWTLAVILLSMLAERAMLALIQRPKSSGRKRYDTA
mgnify:CR=1 FL=1